jgi:hypothetical protein
MAKVRLDHLTDEELEYLVFLGKDALNRLDEILYQITQTGTTLNDMGFVIDDPKFLGGGNPEDEAAKILGDIYDEVKEIVEEAKRLLRRLRKK